MEIINITDEIIEVNVTEAVVNVVTQTGAYPLPSNVFSVFGRVGNVVGQAGDYTTSLVTEGTNLYYTQARFDTAFGNKTTTDLTEGTNLYYTDARSRAAISENITGMEYSSASGIFTLASGYVIPTQASLDAKVPYTGATGNVTLGEYQLTAGQIAFDQTPTGSAGVGVMRWNNTDGTLDLGLKGGNVTLQLGQEIVARVVNKTGADLLEANYQVVRISSAQGQRLAVQLAQANNDLGSVDTIGIVTETITNNQEGFITILGQVREINTTGSLQGETWPDGDVLYLSPTTAGKITNIKPSAPQHMVVVGYVEYAHAQHGKIYAKIQNGYELDELHDVAPTPYIDKGVLYRDTATNLWKSATIGTLLGYTPVTSARTINTTAPLTGGGDLSADRTLSMPAATTSASGYLTSTDWNTFNNKENFLASGTTAQYYRGDKTFQTLNTTAVAEGTNLYYTADRFNTAFSGKTTTDLAEGTNLYFTTARAQGAISGTLPISVSGGVVSISQSSGSSNGYLSSTDWNTFNSKQAALSGTGFVKISGTTISYDNSTYLTSISGISAGGELSGTYPNPTLVNGAVTGKILSGVNITGGTIADTDSILTAFGKLQNQINGLIGSSIYEGTWNATTNTPTLASGVGTQGSYYIVSVSGTTTIDGISDWNVGDWIIFDGTAWQQVDNTDAVVSVNGQTGAVSLTTDNITEGATNLYFTNGRAIASTLTGYTSGAGTISSSDTILQAIQKLNGNVSGLVTGVSSVFGRTGAVTAASGDYTTTQVTEGTNLYYTDVRVSANSDVAANTAARHSAVTLGTANGLSLSTQQLSLALASSSATGALSSTDWNTFNGKQAALNGTGFVKISGTTISYDNSTYLTTSSAASTYLPLAGGTLTGALNGTSASFSSSVYVGSTFRLTQSSSVDIQAYTGAAYSNLNYDAASHNWQTGGGTAKMVLTNIGNLGLGTTTPSRDPSGTRSLAISGASAGYAASLDLYATRNYAIYTGGAGSLGFYDLTAGAERLTIASTGAATFSSSVTATKGILGGSSATSSVANLEVFGSTQVSTNYGQIRINDSVTTSKTLSIGVDGANNLAFLQSFQDGVAYRPLILNALGGNVLIGTSSDNGSKLQVQGNARFNYSDGYGYFGLGYVSGADYGFYNYNYGRTDLQFSQSTGAATFSNFVFADSFGATGNNTMSSWGASPVRPIIEGREGNALSNYVGLPEMYMTSNAIYNGTAWVRKSANASMNMVISGYNNNFLVQSAPSGSAGGAVSFSTLFYINGANGGVGIGTTSIPSPYKLRVISAGAAQGDALFAVDNNVYNGILVYSAGADGYNGAASVMIMGKNTSTNRSLNAGGTINASGADYAEYMTKAIEDNIAKGDIVGVDENGLLTNIFANAKSFVVKSTDPSYVGGDTWGNVDDIGKLPVEPTEEQKAEHQAKLEAARAKVDRIAFSGQVPCNVYNAKVGDYIIPIEVNNKISGQAVSNPTFEQYQISVGKVWRILEDGRAWIAVKIG